MISASHSDLSRPLREQPLVWPPSEAEHEVNLNPQIPHQHKDGPDPVTQSSLWQRMIGVPSIPAPILSWNGIPFPGVGCNCAPPDTNGEVGKVSLRRDAQRRPSGFWQALIGGLERLQQANTHCIFAAVLRGAHASSRHFWRVALRAKQYDGALKNPVPRERETQVTISRKNPISVNPRSK